MGRSRKKSTIMVNRQKRLKKHTIFKLHKKMQIFDVKAFIQFKVLPFKRFIIIFINAKSYFVFKKTITERLKVDISLEIKHYLLTIFPSFKTLSKTIGVKCEVYFFLRKLLYLLNVRMTFKRSIWFM